MKNLALSFLMICLFITLVSCDDDNKISEKELSVIRELPVYSFTSTDEDTLLNMKKFKGPYRINSEADLNDALNDKFLKAYPEYTSIDFTKHTLIVHRLAVANLIQKREMKYKWNEEGYNLWVVYTFGERLPEDTMGIEIIGVVVNKLDDDEQLLVWNSEWL